MTAGRMVKAALTAIALNVALSSTAHAGLAGISGSGAWRFFGNCQDCAIAAERLNYPVTATLTLRSYIQGTALNNTNFVSFTYDGSNLLAAYTVTAPPTPTMSGTLFSGGAQRLSLDFGSGRFFQLGTQGQAGQWSTCFGASCNVPADIGISGSFVFGAQVVPEPSTYALMALGLGVLGAAARRRQRVR